MNWTTWHERLKLHWDVPWKPTCHIAELLQTVKVYPRLFFHWDQDAFKLESQHRHNLRLWKFWQESAREKALIFQGHLLSLLVIFLREISEEPSWCFRQLSWRTKTSLTRLMCQLLSMKFTPRISRKQYFRNKAPNSWDQSEQNFMSC